MNNGSQLADSPRFVVTAEGELYGEDSQENQEIVRRIHACVNACDGISTEDLEGGIIHDICRVLADAAPVLEERMGQAVSSDA